MDRLKLNEEQQKLFEKVIHEAYNAGTNDGTFISSSLYQLLETYPKVLSRLKEKYLEK